MPQDGRPPALYLHTQVQSGDCDMQSLFIREDQLRTGLRRSSSWETTSGENTML